MKGRAFIMAKTKVKKRKDGRYAKQIVVGRREDGTPIKKTAYGYTLKELEENYFKLQMKYKTGVNLAYNKTTFGDYAIEWFKIYKSTKSAKTQEMYLNLITNHIDSIADIEIDKMTTADIQKCINECIDKPTTARQLKMFIKAVYKCAIEVDRLLTFNPCVQIELPRIPRSKKNRDLTELEREAFLFADLDLEVKTYLYIAGFCGLRKGEILALDKQHINLDKNIIEVRNSREETKFIKAHIKELPKSQAGYRDVVMPGEVRDVIIQYMNSIDTDLLFTKKDGSVRTDSSHKKFWNRCKKQLNDYFGADDIVTDLCSHILRHEYSTNLFYSGVDELEAQQLMGHADISTTRKIYTHLRSEKKSAGSKLDDFTKNMRMEYQNKTMHKKC